MEQSRVGSAHSPQGGSAPVRGKTMAKPSDEAAQEAAGQGGFLALMAALEQSPEVGGVREALDLQTQDAGLVAIQGTDPVMQMQAAAASSCFGTRTLPTEGVDAYSFFDFRESLGAGSLQTEGRDAGSSWNIDLPHGGLVAQTTALDRLGDVKDGDLAATALSSGRPAGTRATAVLAQRGEPLSAGASSLLTKGLPSDFAKTLTSAAGGLSVALATSSAASLREVGGLSAGGVHAAGSSPSFLGLMEGEDTSVLNGQILPVVPKRGGEPARLSDLGSTGVGNEGAQDGAPVEVSLPAGEAASLDVMAPFSAEEALAERVTYWVNQKVQSAEMTVSRDGQPVEVSVTLSGNEAQVAFRSDQEQTRQLLDASMAQLSEMLRGQGLVLSGASVGTSARDGRSSGESSQERAPKAGQTRVVAAEGISVRANHIQTGRGAIDVFV